MNEICGINNWNGSLGGKGSLIRGTEKIEVTRPG